MFRVVFLPQNVSSTVTDRRQHPCRQWGCWGPMILGLRAFLTQVLVNGPAPLHITAREIPPRHPTCSTLIHWGAAAHTEAHWLLSTGNAVASSIKIQVEKQYLHFSTSHRTDVVYNIQCLLQFASVRSSFKLLWTQVLHRANHTTTILLIIAAALRVVRSTDCCLTKPQQCHISEVSSITSPFSVWWGESNRM